MYLMSMDELNKLENKPINAINLTYQYEIARDLAPSLTIFGMVPGFGGVATRAASGTVYVVDERGPALDAIFDYSPWEV